MKKALIILAILMLNNSLPAVTWTALDYPGATSTQAWDIDGSNIVGYYTNSTGTHGFLYNGSTWTTIDAPGAPETYIRGIDGSNIVGYYRDTQGNSTGFLNNGSTWTNLPYLMYDIQGSKMVGAYGTSGYFYDGSTWTKMDMPGAGGTFTYGIDGQNFVGRFYDNYGNKGFIYDGTTWTPISAFGADSTYLYGISGNKYVGYFSTGTNAHGLLFDGTDLLVYDITGVDNTKLLGIDGNKIVGIYWDTPNYGDDAIYHGFVANVPEPASILIFTLGTLFLRKRKNAEVL